MFDYQLQKSRKKNESLLYIIETRKCRIEKKRKEKKHIYFCCEDVKEQNRTEQNRMIELNGKVEKKKDKLNYPFMKINK